MIGKPWFLSIVSGVIAALLYFSMHREEVQNASKKTQTPAQRSEIMRKAQYRYALVFVVIAFLVYGSFALAVSAGECKLVESEGIEIQTGGCPPF